MIRVTVLLGFMGLTACSMDPYIATDKRTRMPPPQPLPPIEQGGEIYPEPVPEVPQEEVKPYKPDPLSPIDQGQAATRKVNPAVEALLATAQSQQRAGDLTSAFATLERAVRISPREPKVYLSMAHVRYEQELYAQAEQFALKAVSFDRVDLSTQKAGWQIVASARMKQGDDEGALKARRQAKRL